LAVDVAVQTSPLPDVVIENTNNLMGLEKNTFHPLLKKKQPD
jgi:hypothetical protein